jgi:hypothetical protein
LKAVAVLLAVLSIAAAAVTLGGRQPASAGDAERWQRAHRAAVKYRRQRDHLQELLTRRVLQVRSLRHQAVHRADSLEAIRLAAIAYHVSYQLLYRIASCESTGGSGLNPNAKNRSSTASGLAQFLTSTWSSTRYAHESIFSPYASALAMAEEVAHGNAGWQWAASRGCWS